MTNPSQQLNARDAELTPEERRALRSLVARAAGLNIDDVLWVSEPPGAYLVTSNGHVYSALSGRRTSNAVGYKMEWMYKGRNNAIPCVGLSYGQGPARNVAPGRLVAEAFLGLDPHDRNKIVKYRDGNASNPRLNNLLVIDRREGHRLEAYRRPKNAGTYSDGIPVRVRKMGQGGAGVRYASITQAARALGVQFGAVSYALRKRRLCRGHEILPTPESENDHRAHPPVPIKITRRDGTTHTFPSVQKAMKETGIDPSTLYYHARKWHRFEQHGITYERADKPPPELEGNRHLIDIDETEGPESTSM